MDQLIIVSYSNLKSNKDISIDVLARLIINAGNHKLRTQRFLLI